MGGKEGKGEKREDQQQQRKKCLCGFGFWGLTGVECERLDRGAVLRGRDCCRRGRWAWCGRARLGRGLCGMKEKKTSKRMREVVGAPSVSYTGSGGADGCRRGRERGHGHVLVVSRTLPPHTEARSAAEGARSCLGAVQIRIDLQRTLCSQTRRVLSTLSCCCFVGVANLCKLVGRSSTSC